jgi:hypothetical protein
MGGATRGTEVKWITTPRQPARRVPRDTPPPERPLVRQPLVKYAGDSDGLRAALMWSRHRHRRRDVILADGVVLVCPVPGRDPVRTGALIGFFVVPVIGAIPGALLGRRVGRRRAAERYRTYSCLPLAALQALPGCQTILVREVGAADLEARKFRRRLTLHGVVGGRLRFAWDERVARNDAGSWALPYVLGARLRPGAADARSAADAA